MTRVEVASSNVHSVGYDAGTLTLEVQFRNGRAYQYTPVSPEVHMEIMASESIGRSINVLVKGDPAVTTTAVVDEPEVV